MKISEEGQGRAAPIWARGVFRSAVNRLITAHFGLIAAATALVLAYVFYSTSWLIEAQLREVVAAEVRGLEDDYERLGVFGLAQAIRRRSERDPGGDSVYLLAAPDGRRIAGNLARWPASAPAGAGWIELELSRVDRRERSSIEALSLRLPQGERLLVGRDAAARRLFDVTLRNAVISALVVLAALTVLVGYALSRLLRRRLAAISEAAEGVISGDLARRAPESAAGDEFDRVSGRLNAMLDRIGDLVADLRMVTDSVAHDLRSPLTRLRGHLEAALADLGSSEGAAGEAAQGRARERIEAALAEAEAALGAFASLIAIARAEAGVGRDQFEPLDLSALVAEIAELYEPAAEAAGMRLTARAGPGLSALGHRQLLAQALSNLIENAIAHGGGEIAIEAVAAGPEVALRVRDGGPGVPAEARERALGRFVQLDPARGGSGAGLGLALVAAVARLHGGRVVLRDAAPGAAPPGLAAEIAWPAEANIGQVGPAGSVSPGGG